MTARRREGGVAIAYDCLFPYATGGGERVYRRMAELVVERGIAVDYLTRRQWSGDDPHPGFGVVPIWDGEIYDADGTRTPGSAVGFATALFRSLVRRRRRYDAVVVSALPVLNVFAARAALAGSGTRVVTDWLEVWPWRKWREYSGAAVGTVAWVLQWFGIRLGGIHTANSSFTRDRIRARMRGADPIVLGLVDLVGQRPAEADRPAVDPFVVFVGRHIADKRLDALPAALAVARQDVPGLLAVVAGTGPQTDALRDEVARLGLGDAVEIAGRVSDERLDELLGTAAALVNPSAREGFGLVIAEAAAFGTPSVVVAGPDNAAADLVVDGVNGFVAPTAEAADLGAAIVAAVTGGAALRASTAAWFSAARDSSGLARSVDELLGRAGVAAVSSG